MNEKDLDLAIAVFPKGINIREWISAQRLSIPYMPNRIDQKTTKRHIIDPNRILFDLVKRRHPVDIPSNPRRQSLIDPENYFIRVLPCTSGLCFENWISFLPSTRSSDLHARSFQSICPKIS